MMLETSKRALHTLKEWKWGHDHCCPELIAGKTYPLKNQPKKPLHKLQPELSLIANICDGMGD